MQTGLIQKFKNFLKDRKQKVIVSGQASDWHSVLSGILQGSVLGLILFVIDINTLPEIVKKSKVYLFADDTKVFKAIDLYSKKIVNICRRI